MISNRTTGDFSGEENVRLNNIKGLIVEHLRPMVIFCFESTLTTTIDRSCFPVERKIAKPDFACSLLIILPGGLSEPRNAGKLVTELAETRSKVYALVHPLRFALTQMYRGNLFFNWVRREGAKLYDRGDAEIYLARPIPNRKEWEIQAHDFFQKERYLGDYLTEILVDFFTI